MLRLEIIEGPDACLEALDAFTVGPAGATVGRTGDCDWCLEDPSNQISRRHFQVVCEGGAYQLEDTSTNGSFLNGAAAPVGRGNRAEIKDGDQIALGEYVIRVSVGQASPLIPEGIAESLAPDLGPAPAIIDDISPASKDSPLADVDPDPGREPAAAPSEILPEKSTPFDAVKPTPMADGLLGSKSSSSYRDSPLSGSDNHRSQPLPGDRGPSIDSGLKVPVSSPHDPSPILDSGSAEGILLDANAAQMPHREGFGESQSADSEPQLRAPPETPQAPGQGVRSSSCEVIPEGWENWSDTADEQSARPEEDGFRSPSPIGSSAAGLNAESAPRLDPIPAPPASPPGIESPLAPPSGAAATERNSADSASESQSGPAQKSGDDPLADALREALGEVLGDADRSTNPEMLIRVVQTLASIVSVMTPLLMASVASRSQFKESLRLRQTLIRARENNPLKVSGDDRLALRRLVLNNEPGMLHGVEAIEEAFNELADHQAAMVAALQPAIQSTLETLSPQVVEQSLPASALERIALGGRGGKLWQLYEQRYQNLTSNGGRAIEQRFLNALADEYDRALLNLKR